MEGVKHAYMPEEQDVVNTNAEEQPQAESAAAEQNSEVPSGEDVKAPDSANAEQSEQIISEENKIPVSRVKEMIAKEKEKTTKELLEKMKKSVPQYDNSQTSDEIKRAEEYVKNLVRAEIEPLKAQTELERAMNTYPDFVDYKDKIAEVIQANPSLGFMDAYKIARFDDSIKEAENKGKQNAYQSMQKKKAAGVESARPSGEGKRKSVEGINVFDKSVPLKEIERQLNELTGN